MSLVNVNEGAVVQIDQARILQALKLDPNDPKTQALLLVCQNYGLDPVLKHMVLISGNPYITRDGYLHIAHASGVFDGMEVLDAGETEREWWAKVSVYRKDMGRPFSYIGRYPKKDAGHMAKYGPEMAMKVAEVMALRRAFDVTGVGAAEEQWADSVDVVEADDPEELEAARVALADRVAALSPEKAASLKAWWKAEGIHPMKSVSLAGIARVNTILDGFDEEPDTGQDEIPATVICATCNTEISDRGDCQCEGAAA